MKQHYFQRYHKEENLPLVNTSLLMKRLYLYSNEKFYKLLNHLVEDKLNIEPRFDFREYADNYVEPLLTLSQPSYKISIETKLNNMFAVPMFSNHLSTFSDENYQILITLGVKILSPYINNSLKEAISSYNKDKGTNIIHVDLDYNMLILKIKDILSENDEFLSVLEDYKDYCISQNLINLSYD